MEKEVISEPFSLNEVDWKKIRKGALIACLGALLTYVAQLQLSLDFGQYAPFITALLSVGVNAGWKWIAKNKQN